MAPVRTVLAQKNNSEQFLKTSFQPKKPSKVPERKSAFIFEQMQKPLCEQNYEVKNLTEHPSQTLENQRERL
jgi:hypothetical protein